MSTAIEETSDSKVVLRNWGLREFRHSGGSHALFGLLRRRRIGHFRRDRRGNLLPQ